MYIFKLRMHVFLFNDSYCSSAINIHFARSVNCCLLSVLHANDSVARKKKRNKKKLGLSLMSSNKFIVMITSGCIAFVGGQKFV